MVTAFASDLQLVPGQLATDEKSNEITAIPKLLDMFYVSGNIITIDAIGTQTAIAAKFIEKAAIMRWRSRKIGRPFWQISSFSWNRKF